MTNIVEVNTENNEMLLKISGFTKSDEQMEILQKIRDNTSKLKDNARFLVDLSEFKVTEDINMIVRGMSGNLITNVTKTAIVLPASAVGTLTINSILKSGDSDSTNKMELFSDINKASKWLDSL